MQNKVEHVEDTPGESEGLIKTPRQLIVTIILAFLIPIFGIILLVKLVAVTSPMGAGTQAQSSEAIAERLQPVARFTLVSADTPTESRTGQQIYESTCAACHATGVAGAPTIGDNAAWAPLIETGFDEMVRIAIEGVGAMPPRGGNSSLSDAEVARAVAYMANNSGGSFDEPADDAATDGSDDAADTQDTAAADTTSEPATAQADTDAEAETTSDAAATPVADAATEDAADADTAELEAASEQAADAADEAPQAAAAGSSPDPAEVQQILTKNACLACHAIENKMIGPAYREVAEKYASDPDAAATIAQHIKGGSSGIWGPIPMPPNPGVSDDELEKIVQWIMAGAPS